MEENQVEDVQYCSNCKKDIASANFVMHEIHCKRHIVLCKKCHEPVPKSEEEEHFETYHAKVECDLCKIKVEKSHLEQHKDEECESRPQTCSYCELQMPKCELPSHLSYCGTRTEPCAACDQFIMIKDFNRHLDSNCQYPPRKPPPPAVPQSTKPANFYGRLPDPFSLDDIHRILDEADVPPYLQLGRNNYDQPSGSSSTVRNNTTDKRRKNTTNSKSEVNRHNDMSAHSPQNTEYDSMLSQLISASRDPDEDLTRYMETIRKQSNGYDYPSLETDANINSFSDDFQVPCEFCGESFSSYSIIQHQSGCELTMGNDWTSLPPSVEPNNEVEPEIHRSTAYVPVINNLHDRQHLWRSTEQLVNDIDSDNDSEDVDVELPCEFCTELYPSNMLVIHQSICEANTTSTPRVRTPATTVKPAVYKNDYHETINEPEDNFITRRKSRRQVSPPGLSFTESSRNNNYHKSDYKVTSPYLEDDFDVNTANNDYSRLTSNGNIRSNGSFKRRSSKPKETLERLLKDDAELPTRDSKRNLGSSHLNTGVSGGAGYLGEVRKQKVPISAKKVYDEVERETRSSKKSNGTRNTDMVNIDSIGAAYNSRQRSTYLLNGDPRSGTSQTKARSQKPKTSSRR